MTITLSDSIQQMQQIQMEAEIAFDDNKLINLGFVRCSLFYSIVREYPILLLGSNPGGNPDEIGPYDEQSEIHKFQKQPDYHEFLYENYPLVRGMRTIYREAFGEERVNEIMKKTFA